MDYVTEAHIQTIEDELSQRLIQRFKLNLRTLVYDGTNFFTYIDTNNPATLPARGHNKQKRGDLRQVSLGMLVSTDFHIPLFHKVYTGNLTDTTVFKTISQELCQRYRQLAQQCQHITMIFDKGNNSAEALDTLDTLPPSTSLVRWCQLITRIMKLASTRNLPAAGSTLMGIGIKAAPPRGPSGSRRRSAPEGRVGDA